MSFLDRLFFYRPGKTKVSLFLLFFIFLAHSAFGQSSKYHKTRNMIERQKAQQLEEEQEKERQDTGGLLSPVKLKKLEEKVIEKDKAIAEKIDDLAESIDLFLAGRKLTDRKNDTRLRLIGFAENYEGGESQTTGHVDFSLRLPNLEEYWQLKFTSSEPTEFQSLDRNRPGAAPGRTKYGASLGLFRRLGNFDTTFQPRISLTDPLTTFYLLAFTNKVRGTYLTFRPEFKFFADSQEGTGQTASFGIDYPFSKTTVLRLINEEQYLDLQALFSTNIGPEFLFSFNEKTGMTTSLTFYSISRPVYHLDHYIYLFSIRHQIYKNIFYVQLSPSLKFEKTNNFKGKAGIGLQLEFVF